MRHGGPSVAKRSKAVKKTVEPPPEQPQQPVAHPPARRPLLLAASLMLFALWLVFLIALALWN
jgi:hypothetical protein